MAELFAKSASFTDKGIVEQQEAMEEDIFVDVETKSWSHCDMSRNISGGWVGGWVHLSTVRVVVCRMFCRTKVLQ